jgi:parvulin-like peptidyl-prolyl isomerase
MKKLILFGLCLLSLSPFSPAEDSGSKGKVAARVNGEPIYESELEVELPGNSFALTVDRIKQAKLKRVIQARIICQLLKGGGVEVSADEVNAEIEKMRTKPLRTGCPCCAYPSFEVFMKANAYDIGELRTEISNIMGLPRYMERQWEKAYPPGEKRDKLLAEQRGAVEREYVKLSHIFIPEGEESGGGGLSSAESKSQDAWGLLQKGESFDSVKKRFSSSREDEAVADGLPERVKLCYCTGTLKDTVGNLKPGEYGKPLPVGFKGYCIFRAETLTDRDIIEILKDEFSIQNKEKTVEKAIQDARVEKSGF